MSLGSHSSIQLISRRAALSLPFIALAGSAAAQMPAGWSAAIKAIRDEGLYIPALKLVRAWDRDPAQGPLDQLASVVGEEAIALGGLKSTPAAPPSLANAAIEDALPIVVASSRGRRVVVLNEAHNASRHRAFLAQVLRALRTEGFTHFAAETFTNGAAIGRPRVEDLRPGKPLLAGHGFYTVDPVYAEAVREARDAGYQLVGYEQRADQSDAALSGTDAISRREVSQAENLLRALTDQAEARFVVFVGYSHLRERPDPRGNVWLAARLKAAGIDPLTIAQTFTGAYGPRATESPLSQAVLDRFNPSRPSIIRLADGGILGAEVNAADLALFHPVLPDVDGRPGWLAADPKRRRVNVPLPGLTQPALVQAMHASEPDSTIPADQYAPDSGSREAALFLRSGEYLVRLELETGREHLTRVRV